MSETGMYVTLLVVGIALTFLVGRLLVTAGEPFLEEVFQDTSVTRSVNLLLSVLFHLITLGVIAIASVVNIFFRNPIMYWIITYAGILIFVGLTAYDTQKIKQMNIIGNEGTEEDHKEAIMGALTLYLDFINLFLYLLRLFGRSND